MPVDFEERVLELYDRMDKKLDDLCNRTTILEESLKNHFDAIRQNQESKQRRFYVLFGLLGAAFTVYEIIKGMI